METSCYGIFLLLLLQLILITAKQQEVQSVTEAFFPRSNLSWTRIKTDFCQLPSTIARTGSSKFSNSISEISNRLISSTSISLSTCLKAHGEHLLWREGADNRAGKRDDFSECILGRRLRTQISCHSRDLHCLCKRLQCVK